MVGVAFELRPASVSVARQRGQSIERARGRNGRRVFDALALTHVVGGLGGLSGTLALVGRK